MIFMTIVTIWALFGDDIRRLATQKPADEACVVLTTICLIGFERHFFRLGRPRCSIVPNCGDEAKMEQQRKELQDIMRE